MTVESMHEHLMHTRRSHFCGTRVGLRPRHLDTRPLTMSKLFTKLQVEINALLPPTIFFFVALHLIALIRVPVPKGTEIALNTSWQVTVAALIH